MRVFILFLMLALPFTGKGAEPVEQCRAIGLSECPLPFDTALPFPSEMLQWDQATRLVGFRNNYRLYPGDVFINRGATPFPLRSLDRKLPNVTYRLNGQDYSLEDYLRRQDVVGLLLLRNGKIVYEYYGRGNGPTTLWTSRSVAKSVTSILIGMAIKEQVIPSLDISLVAYVPELAGTAWDGVSLRQLLSHSSAVAWNENYADPESDFAHLTSCEARTEALDCIMTLLRGLKRREGHQPGDIWAYNTGGAWLAGLLLERATHMTLAAYLESHLWSRFAMERPGVWQALVKGKTDMGGHGFHATLRDWGRFGLFVSRGGKLADGSETLPADWLALSTRWSRLPGSVTNATPDGQFGLQW